jgi:hypothetical protein
MSTDAYFTPPGDKFRVSTLASLRFWQYLDQHADVGGLVKELSKAGYDPRYIAQLVFNFVLSVDEPLKQKQKRGDTIKRSLAQAIKGLDSEIEARRLLFWTYRQPQDAAAFDDLHKRKTYLEERLARCDEAFDLKRFGVAGSWVWLAILKECAAAAGKAIDWPALAQLVTAARFALGWKFQPDLSKGRKDDRIYIDSERLRKNVQNFCKRNPLLLDGMRTYFRDSHSAFLSKLDTTSSETK